MFHLFLTYQRDFLVRKVKTNTKGYHEFYFLVFKYIYFYKVMV